MATVVTKALLGREDLDIQDSTTTTFSRATSTGGTTSITSLGRHTFNTREYDVTQWGAVGNGTTDDTAAIQAAIDAAEAAGGGTIVFPAGYTFLVKPTAANTPIFTLPSGNLTFVGDGATIKVEANASTDSTTAANEEATAYVFKAIGYDNLTFRGIRFDGDKDASGGYNRFGFFAGVQCDHVLIENCEFIRTGNQYGGSIYGTAYNSADSTIAHFTDWKIKNNHFSYADRGIHLLESMSHIDISGNVLEWMNLVNTTGFYSSNSVSSRAIRFTGFFYSNAATHGDIHHINVSDNDINGSYLPIEFWNQYSTGTVYNDPSEAHDLTFNNNRVWGIWGINVNSASYVTINSNTIRRVVASDIDSYLGSKGTLTSANFIANDVITHAIEMSPGSYYTANDNVIDCGYVFSTHASLGRGISVGYAGGEGDFAETGKTISGNHISRCHRGISVGQTDNSTIQGNVIRSCNRPIYSDINIQSINTGVTHAGNRLVGNVIYGDSAVFGSAGTTSQYLAILYGSWTIADNDFVGQLDMPASCGLLLLRGIDSDDDNVSDIGAFVLAGNRFNTWEARCVDFGGSADAMPLSLFADGNTFMSGNAAPSSSVRAFSLSRPGASNTVSVQMGTNYAFGVEHAIRFSGTGGGTESYDFGTWKKDTTMTRLWRHDSGGAAMSPAVTMTAATPVLVKNIQIQAVAAATITASQVLPTSSVIHGVTYLTDTSFTGATSINIGYGTSGVATDGDAWGAATTLAGTTNPSNWTIAPGTLRTGTTTTNRDIILTANGSNFTTTGLMTVQILYSPLSGQLF